MEDKKFKTTDAVESVNIEKSNTLDTKNVGDPSLLKHEPLDASYEATGTALVLQNTVQVADISRDKDKYDLLEIDWSYKNTTSKPYIIRAISWNTSDQAGTSLMEFGFPRDYFFANHVLQNIGNTFMSFRGDLHFVLTAHGTPVSSGSVIVYPDYWPFEVNDPTPLHNAFVRQFAILDISDNTSTVDLVVPFKYFRNGIDPFELSSMINIRVLAPLAGMNSVTLTLSVFLENQEFKFLRPITNEALEKKLRPGIRVHENIPENHLVDLLKKKQVESVNVKLNEPVRKTQGLLNITTVNNTLENIENATLPTNMTGDEMSASASMMDDVGIPTNPSGVLVKFNSLNNCDNPQAIDKMTLISKAQRVSTPATFNTTMDEMSHHHLLGEREHLVTELQIGTSLEPGAQIHTNFVTPARTIASVGNETSGGVNLLGHVVDKYKYWRGGMKYRLRFYMNRFQSIKIYCGLFYKTTSPAVIEDWSSSHGAIIDIGGDQREITLEIPYNSETPWLQVPHARLFNYLGDENTLYDYSLGQFAIYAATPLITPEGSPKEIKMVMTEMVSDDFELANYTPSNRTQAEVMLSKRSIRTPNYITDVVNSVKQYFSKWQRVSGARGLGMTRQHSYNMAICGAVFTRNQLVQTVNTDNVQLREVVVNQFEHMIHSHYSGGLKFRIEMSKIVLPQIEPKFTKDMLKPYCYFVNPDPGNVFVIDNNVVTQIANALDIYKTKGVENVSTPYISLPVNSYLDDDTVVYEIEVPYQRNIKYTHIKDPAGTNHKSLDYGYLLFGYTTVNGVNLDASLCQMSYTMYAKIADDGRFATIEKGSFPYVPIRGPTWGITAEA